MNRWSNVPLPEAHLAALGAAAAAHFLLPVRLPVAPRTARRLGGPMLAAGAGLAAWAVASAGETDVGRNEALLTDGAYALSRNPMYVGWSAGILGLALWTRSAWLLAAGYLAVGALDHEIDGEEARLLDRFGPAYERYRQRVPRYLGRP